MFISSFNYEAPHISGTGERPMRIETTHSSRQPNIETSEAHFMKLPHFFLAHRRQFSTSPSENTNLQIGLVVGLVGGFFVLGICAFLYVYRGSIRFSYRRRSARSRRRRKSSSSKGSSTSKASGAGPAPKEAPPPASGAGGEA